VTKTFILSTLELDSPALAVEEILSELAAKTAVSPLLKNTVGIISCHHEFVHSEVVAAVCAALPFDVCGMVASPSSTGDRTGSLVLQIYCITADDVEFEIVLTPPLVTDPYPAVYASYKAAADKRDTPPRLALFYGPFMQANSGDEYLNALTKAYKGVPIFGSLAVDDTQDFANSYTIHNGAHFSDRAVLVLAYGNISPRFYVSNISPGRISEKAAIITKSSGHLVQEVNGRPVREYFADMGLAKASELRFAMSMLAFVIDYNDDTPLVARMFVIATDDGHALYAGGMPEGAHMYLAPSDKTDVLHTTGITLKEISGELDNLTARGTPASGALIHTCVARAISMGMDTFAELDLIKDTLFGKIPYLATYSGGEFCPTTMDMNRFHNNSLVICVF